MGFLRQKPDETRPAKPSPPPPGAKIETVIGPNCQIQGSLQSDGGIRIDGVVQGDIETTGNLIIGESAKVIAEIHANTVSVSGAVKGNINANRVEVLETGRVWGDLAVNSLTLDEGAYLRGQTLMHADIEPPLIEPPKAMSTPPPPPPPKKTVKEAVMGDIVDIETE